LLEWAKSVQLAEKIEITNDAALLLAAGTPEGWGLAVVAGTGSIAIAQDMNGASARAGGWGPLLGDEGSAYQIALAGLRAVALAADQRGAVSGLSDRLPKAIGVATPQDMVPKIYGRMDRPAIAALAQVVIEAADAGDLIAAEIVQREAESLAQTARVAMRRVFSAAHSLPVALAGGMFVNFPTYRQRFVSALASSGIAADPLTLVTDPAEGALRLAQRAWKP
jgi:N-acetylglucosamine kinase-like BadF-type ATPase